MSVNDLKLDIISMISDLTDVRMLSKIRGQLQQSIAGAGKTADIWQGAATEIRSGVTFEDLMEEQNYQPVSFGEFQEIVSEGEWETSLDELLKM